MILHVDMDAFFASIEQAINPRLKGKPLIVGSRPNKYYTVVCAASYEAKALGIGSGMSAKQAFKACPDLQFVAADQSKYIWTSEQILEMLEGYGFPLNYASIDEFQLDVKGHPDPLGLAAKIQEQIYANFNITASIGIARNWLLAKLASKLKKPRGILLINDDNFKEVLSRAPLSKLCGMGGKTGFTLAQSGVKTCWDLYLNLPGFFEQNPGKFGEGPETPKSIGHSYTLNRATFNPQVIRAWIRLLSEMVGRRLRAQNLACKTIHLWLQGQKTGGFGAQMTFQQPTVDGFEIYQRCLKIASQKAPKNPQARAIGVTASGLLPADSTGSLLKEVNRREALLKAVDRINNRFGEGAIYPCQIISTDSHRFSR